MNENESGFEKIPSHEKYCTSINHNPPTHMVIPYGQQYRHVCPECGNEKVIRSSEIYC